MVSIQFELTGDRTIGRRYVKLENELNDLGFMFQPIGDAVLEDTGRHIDNHPGPPLAPSTIRRKGHTRILIDEGGLRGSYVKSSDHNVFRVRRMAAEFGTSDPKAMYHQEGTSRMPKRLIIERNAANEARYVFIAVEQLKEKASELGLA